jgi:hypothetical protein
MANKSKTFGTQVAKAPGLVGKSKGGVAGEVGDLRDDIEKAFLAFEANGSLDRVEEFLALRAAAANLIKTSIATSNQAATYGKTDLDGSVGNTELVPPRNITVVSTSHADVTAVQVVITGRVRDASGNLVDQTDTITLTAGGGATDAGTKAFSIVDKIERPPLGGAGGSLQFGIGNLVGLAAKPRTLAGYLLVHQQVTNGAVVTNGTFNAAAAPNGTWSPNAAANGTNNYGLRYTVDGA